MVNKVDFKRLLIAIISIVACFLVVWQGFLFFKYVIKTDVFPDGLLLPLVYFIKNFYISKPLITILAVIWGISCSVLLYYAMDLVVRSFPAEVSKKLYPFLFMGPAFFFLTWFMIMPVFRSLWFSFQNNNHEFIGLANYVDAITSADFLTAIKNNIIWLVLSPILSVSFGLFIAILADRSQFENVFKTLIFLPLAISFVGASAIWKFVYYFRPPGETQIGLLNAIVKMFGGDAVNWLTLPPYNTFFLLLIFVWMQTGYAMVFFSAAVKAVPEELLEAARVDGATEVKTIFAIVIPAMMETIVGVFTTITIMTLKVFDIVYSMTGGNFKTHVIASLQYKELFEKHNNGMASAYAMLLLIAVIPVIIYNMKEFNKRSTF